jgi:hypothetical protein
MVLGGEVGGAWWCMVVYGGVWWLAFEVDVPDTVHSSRNSAHQSSLTPSCYAYRTLYFI